MRMMPGQEPYTEVEERQLQGLISDAMDAEEELGIDELERLAYERN